MLFIEAPPFTRLVSRDLDDDEYGRLQMAASAGRAPAIPTIGGERMTRAKRRLFDELSEGVLAMQAHREGKLTLREHAVAPAPLPRVTAKLVRDTRQRLNMSQRVFATRLRVNARTLERWEQGRSAPNEQAAALILLVRQFPDTLDRLAAIGRPGNVRRSR